MQVHLVNSGGYLNFVKLHNYYYVSIVVTSWFCGVIPKLEAKWGGSTGGWGYFVLSFECLNF